MCKTLSQFFGKFNQQLQILGLWNLSFITGIGINKREFIPI